MNHTRHVSDDKTATRFRPPAVPLVVHDPFLSLWSGSDNLFDSATRHWTGVTQELVCVARIDGKTWRLCGTRAPSGEPHGDGNLVPRQLSLEVLPTRTRYTFEAGPVRLTLTFLTPALPHDLDWLSRPLAWIILDAVSTDGYEHELSFYCDVGAEIATDAVNDDVVWGRLRAGDLDVVTISSRNQRLLARPGDYQRIDWGHAYLALPSDVVGSTHLGSRVEFRRRFAESGRLPSDDDFGQPATINTSWPCMAALVSLGRVSGIPVSGRVLLAYDDVYSIEFLHRKLRPWWRRNGMDAARLLVESDAAFASIHHECVACDTRLMRQLRERGGEDYARVAALAFRQCLGAHKLVADLDGTPLYFSKENTSNGCIATVDVTYPSSPFFLALNPALLRAQLEPVLVYAASPRWKFPFAPHDLGTYPLANGQLYGGGETSEACQMPVEECGDMLILVTAYCLKQDDPACARKWWALLSRWAGYLEARGLDPENQLCTDDFAGHLAHNANLSLKAILALGCYARLADLLGHDAESVRVRRLAEDMAVRWQQMADDGDHYRLAFDRPGTWSQKYNLVWDRLLGLDLFPPEVARREFDFYRTRQNRHGLPLDSRRTYTKLDWIFWTASITGEADDFHALADFACAWVSAGATRVPLTDWYETVGDGQQVNLFPFHARSVVGGIFIRQLDRIRQETSQPGPESSSARPASSPDDLASASPLYA
ncbi:MAG: DUF4965 domain-containing protein [Opitutaceae bacterium]|jgi:hypothetical protein|nr:DUF4965 domain-containing protein [Opitutaceae bacterium]